MSGRLAGVHHALCVGSDGQNILAFVQRPGGGYAVLRDGTPVGMWEETDRSAALRAYVAMIDGKPPAPLNPLASDGGGRRRSAVKGAIDRRQ